jgi:hypothetical protein
MSGNQARQISANASTEGEGSHLMKRVTFDVAAANESAASAAVNERSESRGDTKATVRRSLVMPKFL